MNKLVKNGHHIAKKLERTFARMSPSKHAQESNGKTFPSEETCGIKNNSVKDIPGPWPSLPIIGTNWQYFRKYSFERLHEANLAKYHKYGHIVKEEFRMGRPFIHLFRAEDFIKVFRSQGKFPIRPPHDATFHYRKSHPEKYKSVGLTNAQGEEWRRLRSVVSPFMLDLNIMKEYLPKQTEVGDDFITLLHNVKDKQTMKVADLQQYLYRVALESISILCLDARIGCLDVSNSTEEASKMIEATRELFRSFQLLYYGYPFWKFFKTPGYKLLAASEAYLYDTASNYIKEAMQAKQGARRDHDKKLTVLESLLTLENVDPKDARLLLIDFMVAGIDTASNTLTFVFNELAKHQDVQQKLWEEINSVLPDKGDMTKEGLCKLPYLNATIKEVFRLSPTIPGIVRITSEDHIFSGYNVPKNTAVFCHSMIASRLEENFPEPLSFRPERWLRDENKKEEKQLYSVLPFGFGARMCIGRRFAEQEIKVLVAKVLQHFQVELASKDDPPVGQIYRFLVVPDNKLNVKLVAR